jgi:hypothetical protein
LALIATTGFAIASAGPTFAHSLQDAPGTVVREGDAEMTCRQMADEGAALSADMGESGPGLLGRVGGIARAGATLLVPAAGLAVAGAEALTSPGKARREAEADTRRDRWNYLNGLYAGRGCDTSAEQVPASNPPASTTAPTAAPAAPPATPTRVPPPSITPAAFPHL